MNDMPHIPDPPRSTNSTSERFFAWLRGLGIERRDDRWFAGVASGIAAKAGIDPLIVRGVFLVLAVLGGPGILLYLAGWILLPDSSGRIHFEELLRGRASGGVIAVAVVLGVVLVIPTVIWTLRSVFIGPWGFGTWDVVPAWLQITLIVAWWAIAVPALVIWLIVWWSRERTRGSQPTENPPADSPGRSFAEQANNFAEQAGRRATEWGENVSTQADDWGRKIDNKTLEWEQRRREYTASHRLGAAHTLVTLAMTLLVGGATAGWALATGLSSDQVVTAGILAAVAVLGLSSIIAGVRGRTSGWIGFLSFCGVIALIFAPFSAVLPEQTEFAPFGDIIVDPTDQGTDRAIVKIAGNTTVNLSGLTTRAEPRTIEVWLLAGQTTVRLPASTPTRVTVQLMAGKISDNRVSDDERQQSGVLMSRVIESHTKGATSAEIVEVHVRLLSGRVDIQGDSTTAQLSKELEARATELDELRRQIEELEKTQ